MRLFKSLTGLNLLVLLLGLGAGCVTPIPGANRELLTFLQLGQTTRQEVLLHLGQPSATLEQETVLTYRLGGDPSQGYYIISPKQLMAWQSVRYSLVLIFDGSGRLQKQSLVPVQ